MSTQQPTSSGLTQNVAAAGSYVLGPITGILFLVLEKENRFVRFHAMQSIILGVAWIAAWIVLTIVSGILALIPILGWLVALLLWLALALGGLVLWLFLIVKAFQGEAFRLPYVADMADKYAPSV